MVLRRADAAPNAAAKNPPKRPKKAGGQYSCKKCGASLTTARTYEDHLNLHTERQYKCSLCPKAYTCSRSLNRHRRIIHSLVGRRARSGVGRSEFRGRVDCGICGQVFRSTVGLEGHMNRHAGKRECTCPHCLKSFHGEISLLKHVRKVHPTQEHVAKNASPATVPVQPSTAGKRLASKKQTCRECGKVLGSEVSYNAHMNLHSGKRPFKCPHCPKAYAGYDVLKRHRRLIHGTRRDPAEAKAGSLPAEELVVSIPINVCVSETKVAKRLQEKDDKTSPHNSTPPDSTLPEVGDVASQDKGASCQNFECTICGKVLTREFSYRGHMYTHGSNQPFQCSYCDKAYPYQSSLRKHSRLKHGIPMNLQHSQSEKVASKPAVTEEAAANSRSDPSGNESGEKVSPRSEVSPVAHEPTSGPSSYQCGSCSKVLDSLASYKTHLQQHSAKKTSFKCSVCSRTYRSVSLLWLHQRRQHVQFKRSVNKSTSLPSKPSRPSPPKSAAPQLFPCSVCRRKQVFRRRRVFKTRSELDTHMKKCHGPCPKCGRLLCSIVTYEAHMNLHLGRQPYACSKCSKRFHSANSLSKHLCLGKCSPTTAIDCREKEEEKNAVAPQCSVAQKTVENIAVQPVMVPHASKSGQGYKCVLCGKVLSRLDRFKAHMNLHTGAQPFQCEQCGESFSSYSHRYHHKVVKHAGMPTSQPNQQSHASPPKRPRKQMTHSSPVSCTGSEHAPTTERKTSTAERKTSTASVQDCCTGVEDQNVPVNLEEQQSSDTETVSKDCSESEVPDDLLVSIDIKAMQDVANRESSSREPVLTPSGLDTLCCSEDNKPFKCGMCGVVLQQYTAYMAHMNKHTRKRTHKCSQCSMTYPSLASLWNHKRFKHSHPPAAGRQLLKCTTRTRVVGGGATTSHAAETSDPKFACPHCEKTYMRFDGLKRHLYLEHPAPPPSHVMRLRNAESSGQPPTTEAVEKKPQESERITQDGDTVERSCMFDVVDMGVERGGKQEVEGSSALPLESCAAGGGGMGEWETVPVCGEVQVGEGGEGEVGGEQPTTTPRPDTILVKYGSWSVFFFKDNS